MGAVDPGRLRAPEPLAEHHVLDDFACVEPSLADWLRRRARKNAEQGASRTYVVCADNEVVGFYALSAGAVASEQAPGGMRRNMPDPIPAILLGRLAVHEQWSGMGIGAGLLKDAILRSLAGAQAIGARALLCHATSAPAKRFYLHHGFVESPIDPMTLMLDLTKLQG